MKSWITTSACVAAGIVGALAAMAADPTVAPTEGGISAHVALTSLGFTPVKKPKVRFTPHAGQSITKHVDPKVVSFTSTQIDVEVKKGLAGVYDVVVTPRDKGVAPVTLPDTFTIVVPHPATLDPTSGPWKTLLTIHGADFGTPRGRVTVGGKNAAVKQWTDDTIRVQVPPRIAMGPQPVVVKNKAGASDGTASFDCTGAPPKPVKGHFDEFIRADLSGKGHFEATNAKKFGFYVTYNAINSQLTFGGTSQPTKGYPSLFVSMLPLDAGRAVPYDIGLSPAPPVTTIATLSYGEAVPVAALHTASLGGPGAALTVTITGWDGTFLDGTFSGTLVDLVGGTAPIVVTNGQFRTRRETGH